MRALYNIVPVLVLVGSQTLAQTNAPGALSVTNSPSSSAELEKEHQWSFSASAYSYIVPDSREYVQPTVTADHDWLHLEARYNYEGLNTGSVWLGYNLSGGEKLTWELTPMLGGVFGNMTGIAPGYKGSLNWWKLQLYSEGEFVIDVGDTSESFFYNWSELTLSPLDWFRFGLVTQRTRLYHTDRDVQRGVLAGISFKRLDFSTYVFNPDESKPTVVLAVSFHFDH
jgi:hypothetical protein